MAEKVWMIALSPTMEEGTLVKWSKREGDAVASGDVLCEVETDKATMDYESAEEGTLLKILVPEGQKAAVGQAIAILGQEGEDIEDLIQEAEQDHAAEHGRQDIEDQEEAKEQEEAKFQASAEDDRIKASPLARKLAEKHGLSLQEISGSGPKGRIVKSDVLAAAETPIKAPAAVPAKSSLSDETVPVSGKRKIIAKRLAESMFTAPHYYLTVSVSAQHLIEARSRINERLKDKISFNAFLIKFAAEALKQHPVIHSTWQGDTILRHGAIDIALAVALPDGLITPVVRNCGLKGIQAIDAELKVLIQKAQDGALKPEEYQGATFTISNLGSFGIEEFTAIINPPGSAILAVGESRKVPVVGEDGQITADTVMKLTLSCDHRVIDGAEGAAFLTALKRIIEEPIHALV